jgi:hypothetical protein
MFHIDTHKDYAHNFYSMFFAVSGPDIRPGYPGFPGDPHDGKAPYPHGSSILRGMALMAD